MLDTTKTMTAQVADFLRTIPPDSTFTAETVVEHFDANLTSVGHAIAKAQASAALGRFCKFGVVANTGSTEHHCFVYKLVDITKIPFIRKNRSTRNGAQNPYDPTTFGNKFTRNKVNKLMIPVAQVPKPIYDAVESVILDFVPQIALRIAQSHRGLGEYTTKELLAEIQRRVETGAKN